jgi:hypothetical protein
MHSSNELGLKQEGKNRKRKNPCILGSPGGLPVAHLAAPPPFGPAPPSPLPRAAREPPPRLGPAGLAAQPPSPPPPHECRERGG